MFGNRKGQIPAGISWIAGFTIVLFIMIIFIGASFSLIGKKNIPLIGKGQSKIVMSRGRNAVDVESLISFLNSPVERDQKIKDLIVQYESKGKGKKRLGKEIREYVNLHNPMCYIFKAGSFEEYDLPNQGLSNMVSRVRSPKSTRQGYLKKAVSVNIPGKSKKIKVQMYMGECI